ncbi:MAG: NUDIX hydrolase [Candidatus Binatia bacterium]
MRSVADVRTALGSYTARVLDGHRRAAVAIVLHEAPAGPEMLFIERAERLGDPWSGHMAFPGGRVDPGDPDARAAAERETLEEVGLDLRRAEPLGRLDDLHAGVRYVAPLVLSPFVYRIDARVPLTPNHEVREALWVPLDRLHDPAHHVDHRWGLTRFPGILVGEPGRQIVWGLTYQVLEGFFGIAGVPLRPPRQ